MVLDFPQLQPLLTHSATQLARRYNYRMQKHAAPQQNSYDLSPLQIRILQAMATDVSNHEIAVDLSIAFETVQAGQDARFL
jgi:DNA-binding NarL/FixJ family response regulator